jgi:hypothetical protein
MAFRMASGRLALMTVCQIAFPTASARMARLTVPVQRTLPPTERQLEPPMAQWRSGPRTGWA